MLRLHVSLVAFLVTLFPLPIRADEPIWPIQRGPAELAIAYRYNAADLATVSAEFLNDAAACYLYSGTNYTLETDGSATTTTLEVIRLNNRKGIDEFGEYHSITYDPSYERVTLHEARIHKANGRMTTVGPRHIQVRDVNTDHLVYDPSKQIVISFPGLEIGDVLEVHWTVRGRHPEFQDQVFSRYTFGNDKFPVARDEWSVRLPKTRELKFAPINCDLKPTISDDGDRRVFRWTATNRPSPPRGEHKPPADETSWQVAVTTFQTWEAVYRWERQLLADRGECPPNARTVVDEVTRGLSDPTEKARALTRWVRTRVRYVSRGEKHDYTPHPPARVMTDLCGDCKDSAHLLALMCRAAGLKAGSATLGPRGDGQVLESVPSPWGTHALTVITINGRDHWIDTTAARIGWDVLPPDDRDRACFVTDETGIRLARTPNLSASDSRTESLATLNVAVNGDVRGERTVRYSGLTAWTKREELANVPVAERRRSVASDLQEVMPRAKLGTLKIDNLDDPDAPLIVTVEFAAPEFFSGEGNLEGRLGETSLLSALLGATPSTERTVPFDLDEPFEASSKIVVNLPAAFRLETKPARHEATSKWGRVGVALLSTADSPRRIEFESRATLRTPRIEPADFEAWHDFQDAVLAICRATLVLKPTKDPADAPILEQAWAKSPEDGATAAILASIYINQKKPDDALRILRRACEKSPDDRNLWELRANATFNIDEEVELYREMIARFPDEPKFALDLGAALIEQGEFEDAKKILEPLTKHKSPEYRAEALISLARMSLDMDEARKALRHLAAAEKAHPESMAPEIWLLKGQAHEALGQVKPAIDAYRQAAEDDELTEALSALTRLTIASGSRTESLQCLRRFAAHVAGDPEGLARAAEYSIQLQRFDDALELASQSRIHGKEVHPKAMRPLGLAYYHNREFAKAVEHLTRAEPDADGLAALVDSLISLGRLTEAETHLPRFSTIDRNAESRRLVELVKALTSRRDSLRTTPKSPDDPHDPSRKSLDCFVCAESLHVRGIWPDRVEALVDEALSGDMKLGPAIGLRAVLSAEKGRLTRALADADRAILLSAEHPAGYHARGRARFERGQPGALDDLEKAAQLSKRTDARILHDLAAALSQARRTGDALTAQREAAKLRPDDREIRGQLRELETNR